MDLIIRFAQAAIGLILILVVLSLIGISPREAGAAVGEAIAGIGDMFQGIRENS